MRSRIGNTLSLLTLLVATSVTAQQQAVEQSPHLSAMAHQTMTYKGKVIYEADVDQNAPNPKPFVLRVEVDGISSNCATTVGNVAAAASQGPSVGGNASSEYISCVVTELSSDGQAKADVVYEIQDSARNVHKSGHVKANLQVGKEYKTASNDSQVTLLLQTY